MGMYHNRYKIVMPVLTALLVSPAAWAEPAPLSPLKLNARYTIAWSGIALGRINIAATEDDASYSLAVDTKTRGIGAVISDERSVVSARGTKKNGKYIPAAYESKPLDGGDGRITVLTYDETGKLKNRSRTPEDDPARRPPVPVDDINTAHDPITASFMLRREIYAALAEKKPEVTTRTYDGGRLAQMTFIRAADARVEVMGKYHEAVNLVVSRTPISGYTAKELKKYKKGDPEIRVYFTNDAAFLPVRATASTPLGELSMTLVKNELAAK